MNNEIKIDKSIQPKPWVSTGRLVVRWLGAYGYLSNTAQAVFDFESSPNKAVSAEVSDNFGGRQYSPLSTQCKIGLVVDTTRSVLVRAWSGDAFTPRNVDANRDSRRLCSRENGYDHRLRSVSSWDRLHGLHANDKTWYCEALIRVPVYSAIVVTDLKCDYVTAEFISELSKLFGLPVIRASALKITGNLTTTKQVCFSCYKKFPKLFWCYKLRQSICGKCCDKVAADEAREKHRGRNAEDIFSANANVICSL